MDLILNNNYQPSYDEINDYVKDSGCWQNINNYIANSFKAKPAISYSTCSGKPGWNIKYKSKGKSICTLYPESDKYTILIVLNCDQMEIFEGLKENFSQFVQSIYDKCMLFNKTKWLMITVDSDNINNDVKKLLDLKFNS